MTTAMIRRRNLCLENRKWAAVMNFGGAPQGPAPRQPLQASSCFSE
jgi:hypothetical protein